MTKIRMTIIFCLLISLLSPTLAAGLTVSELMNGKYFIPSWEDEDQGEWVQLKDGEYDRKDHDKVLSVKIVATALGRLSPGRGPDAAVIYGYGTGGTGFFVLLCAVTDNQGHPQTSQVINLEDRVKINSLAIRSGKIVVDMLAHRSTDPAPFPTLRKIATYTLVGDKLVEK
jgi:hypothetical protein